MDRIKADRRHASHSRIRSAFTLIELLVVIGIFALLAALLLPAVRQVRAQGQQIQCANNMRQLFVSLRSYAADNKGAFPRPGRDGNPPESGPAFAFSIVNNGGPSSGVIDYNVGSLWRYVGTGYQVRFGLLNCPTDLDDMRLVSGSRSMQTRNFSYSFNSYLSPATNTLGRPLKLFDILHPDHKVIVVEENWPNDSHALMGDVNSTTHLPTFQSEDVPAIRHGGRSNQCFGDGHVECLYPVDVGYSNDLTGFSDPPAVTPGTTAQYYFNPLVP